jgi:catechol-2,3-dioxygenase
MLLATDLGVARRFYGDTLGLSVLLEDEQFLTFRCGGDSRLVVTKSTIGTADEATKASWRVDDIAGEVAELRARGVEIQDLPELNTIDGIADIGFALAAWFVDPH